MDGCWLLAAGWEGRKEGRRGLGLPRVEPAAAGSGLGLLLLAGWLAGCGRWLAAAPGCCWLLLAGQIANGRPAGSAASV